jgi:hypothetical protein
MSSFRKSIYSKVQNLFHYKKKASDYLNSYENKYKWNKYPNIPVVKYAFGTLGISVVSIGATYLLLKKPIHKYITKEGSTVANGIVMSDDVQNSVKEKVTIILKQLCVDKNVQNDLADMFKVLFQRQDIKDDLADMFKILFQRQDIKDGLADMLADVFDEEIVRDKIDEVVKDACKNKENQEQVAQLLIEVIRKETIKKEFGKAIRDSLYYTVRGS